MELVAKFEMKVDENRELWNTEILALFVSVYASLVRENKYVSSGYHHMWVCLGTKQLMSWLFHHSEIHSLQRTKLNLTWRNPPAHHWYAAKSPGLSLQCRSSRAHQTALARIKSGHLRSMTFVQGVKSFFICPCSLPASPAHLLDFWGISLRQLFEDQDLVCDTILRKGQIDLMDLKLDLVKNGLDNVLQGNWKQQQSCSLTRGHMTSLFKGKEDIEDVSSELGNEHSHGYPKHPDSNVSLYLPTFWTALVSACIVASVIGVLSVFLIAFFCLLEAEDVPHEPHETDILTRLFLNTLLCECMCLNVLILMMNATFNLIGLQSTALLHPHTCSTIRKTVQNTPGIPFLRGPSVASPHFGSPHLSESTKRCPFNFIFSHGNGLKSFGAEIISVCFPQHLERLR
ncbi:UNVERIFIED_CONTAM: hypothetical protein NCL1_44662 [Trichonephila clavipes]